jgi:hypothetical protein
MELQSLNPICTNGHTINLLSWSDWKLSARRRVGKLQSPTFLTSFCSSMSMGGRRLHISLNAYFKLSRNQMNHHRHMSTNWQHTSQQLIQKELFTFCESLDRLKDLANRSRPSHG